MRHQRISQEELYLCRCSTTFPVDQETTKQNVWQTPNSYLCTREVLEKDNGHLLVLVLRKSGTVSVKTVHKEYGTELLKGCWLNSQRYEPVVQRSTQKQRTWKTVDTLCSRFGNGWDYFSHNCSLQTSSVFTEQSQRYVKSMNPFTRERGDPLWEGNRVPHSCQAWSRQKCYWIVMTLLTKIFYCTSMDYELKSNHNKTNLENFVGCRIFWLLLKSESISWRKTLQNSHNFVQWLAVNTLCQETKKHHNQKDGSQGTPKLGPYLEIATCCLHGKYGVEIRIWSFNIDNTHSWVRISHGLNKFVVNLINNEQEIPEVQLEECALKLDAKDFACRSKAKAKPQGREPAGSSPRTINSFWEKNLDWCWTRWIFTLRLWSIKESNVSSSSFTTCASRRRWSSSLLENLRKSSESVPTLSSLVWR